MKDSSMRVIQAHSEEVSEEGPQHQKEDNEDDELLISQPFTPEVSKTLSYLRRAIFDVSEIDTQLAQTLTDITDDLTILFEQQILMMFENWGVEERRRIDLLRKEKLQKDEFIQHMSTINSMREALRKSGSEGLHRQIEEDETCRRIQASPRHSPKKKADRGAEMRRGLSAALYLNLSALALRLRAQRAVLYLSHKPTSTLRAISAAPDVLQNQLIIPNHSGPIGSVLTTSVAFNISKVDEQIQGVFKATDQQVGITTKSMIAFPVCGENGRPIGVLEAINKVDGKGWSSEDEMMMYSASLLISDMLQPFSPSLLLSLDSRAVQNIASFREDGDGAQQKKPLGPSMATFGSVGRAMEKHVNVQLVFRSNHSSTVDAKLGAPVATVTNIKELHSYLLTLEESYRQGLNQYVLVEKEKSALAEEVQRKVQKMRVLEDNVAYLEGQLHSLRKDSEPLGPVHEFTAHEVDDEEKAAGGESEKDPMELLRKSVARAKEHGTVSGYGVPDYELAGLQPSQYPNTIALAQRLARSPSVPGAITTQLATTPSPSAVTPTKEMKKAPLALSKLVPRPAPDAASGPYHISPQRYKLSPVQGKARMKRKPAV